MKKILVLSAAILAIQALPVLADEKAPSPEGHHKGKGMEKMFEMQDANKDGSITEEEYLAFGKARFAETDADKDGKITKEEVKTHRDTMKKKWSEERKAKEGEDKPKDKPKDAPPADAPPAE